MSGTHDVDVLDKEQEDTGMGIESGHMPLPADEEKENTQGMNSINQLVSNPIEKMIELYKNICRVSIKTNQQYLSYKPSFDNSYEEMEKSLVSLIEK